MRLVHPEKASQMIEMVEQSLALYAALGDKWWMARVLVLKGMTQTNLAEAKRLVEEGLALGQALGDRAGEGAYAFYALAELSIREGLFQEAENAVRHLIAAMKELGHRSIEARGIELQGYAALWRGEYAYADSVLDEALAIRKELSWFSRQAHANILLGWAKAGQGKYTEASACAELTLTLARQATSSGVAAAQKGALELLSGAALALQDSVKAQRLLEESVSFERDPAQPWFPTLLMEFAVVRHGQPDQARSFLHSALQGATETQDIRPLLHGLPAVALFLADRGEAERAVELYALASRYPHVANSCWFEDVAAKHIAAAAATLPPDVVSAAQERGRARDLWETAEELLEELGE